MKIVALLLMSMFLCPFLEGGEIEKIKELTKEIQILNLLSGFELTEQQSMELKEHVRRAEELERGFMEQLEENATIFEAGLEKSIEILSSGKTLPPSLKKEISFRNHTVKELYREKEDDIFTVAGEVEDMLESQQLQLLKDYVPCLIPPPGEIRIGQSGTSEGLIIHLERIRELSERVYMKKRDIIVERALERKKLHTAAHVEFDEEGERERIGDLLDRAREMSDIEFALGKGELAEEFKGEDIRKDHENEVLMKVRSFLLDPLILKHL